MTVPPPATPRRPGAPSPGGIAPGLGGEPCTFCGALLEGAPNRCPRCGTLLGEAAHDLKRLSGEARRAGARRKNASDLLFLAGLLAGGPVLSAGGRVKAGLFLLLGGALASALHRYSRTSLPATVLIGGLCAAVLAAALTDPVDPADPQDDGDAGASARSAYVAALADGLAPEGGFVEARGPGEVTAWFYLPTADLDACGSYPGDEIRRHLGALGFRRIVVADRSDQGGVCSFRP